MLNLNFTTFPNLETNRLALRQLKPEDENEIFLLRSDERVNKYLSRQRAVSIEDVRKFIDQINKGISSNELIFWAVCRQNNSKLIGTVVLWNISKEQEKGEIGYELLPEFQGNGFMLEAIKKVIRFGFENLQFQAIEAYVNEENFSSIRLLEKLNFKRNSESKDNQKEIIYLLKKS